MYYKNVLRMIQRSDAAVACTVEPELHWTFHCDDDASCCVTAVLTAWCPRGSIGVNHYILDIICSFSMLDVNVPTLAPGICFPLAEDVCHSSAVINGTNGKQWPGAN